MTKMATGLIKVLFLSIFIFVQKVTGKSVLDDKFITILVEDESRGKRSEAHKMPETLSIMTDFAERTYPSTVHLVSSELYQESVNQTDDEIYGVYKLIDENDFKFFVIEKVDGRYHVVEALLNIDGKSFEVQPDIFETRIEKRDRREKGKLKLLDIDLRSSGKRSCVLEPSEGQKKRIQAALPKINPVLLAGVHHVVELCLVADYSVFQDWRNRMRKAGNAAVRLSAHLLYLFHATKIAYDGLRFTDGKTIELSVYNLRIIQRGNNAIIPEASINGRTGLNRFSRYVRSNLPVCDAYTLFTKAGFNAIGIAFKGTACSDVGVSLVRDRCSAADAVIWAHEVGHNLDASHDPASCERDYIMTAFHGSPYPDATGRNKWAFSVCTRNDIDSFLNRRQCFRPGRTITAQDPVFPKRRPIYESGGQLVSLNRQCKSFLKSSDTNWCPQRQGNRNVCFGVFCRTPGSNACVRKMIPYEGSSCKRSDKSMVCISGSCRQNCVLLRRICDGFSGNKRTNCFKRHRTCLSNQG